MPFVFFAGKFYYDAGETPACRLPLRAGEEKELYVPKNKFQRMMFALLTVIITVHAYVFYSLYVIHGEMFMSMTGESGVLAAIGKIGGVPVLGRPVPIWAVVLIEFAFAYCLENLLGSPLSFRFASACFDPRATHPVLFETAIICATVAIMCPTMSFVAAFLYHDYRTGLNILSLLAEWLRLVCFNFPFAFFTQLFFIQPLVRTVFKAIFVREKRGAKSEQSAEA